MKKRLNVYQLQLKHTELINLPLSADEDNDPMMRQQIYPTAVFFSFFLKSLAYEYPSDI